MMSFKTDNQTRSFSDLELSCLEEARNRALQSLNRLSKKIDWTPIEQTLLKKYPTGKKKKGPHAYSPLMLFKCLLLRNWFQISSDADLESLINDRFSFKKFTGIGLGAPAPDSSTFSRFRNRLTNDVYESVLSDVSDQLASGSLILNMGLARDIRVQTTG